uniref:Uncharacterized protein n=1 Tax=Anguilla anguilla TaxID=7936 RepID=A0A0E9QKC3_ANGAN
MDHTPFFFVDMLLFTSFSFLRPFNFSNAAVCLRCFKRERQNV